MKYTDPSRLALITACLITALYLAFLVIRHFFLPAMTGFIILSAAGMFFFSFLIFRYTLQRFVYEKIRVIYKIIRRQKTQHEPGEKNLKPTALDRVEKEVELWTQQQQLEIEELKRLAAYRREFIGNVSHELKTPIFNIQGYVLTLLDGAIHDPGINQQYLERTEKSINRLIAIVEDLEDIARMESGEMKLHLASFDIVQLTREVFEILESKAEIRKVNLSFESPVTRPVFVFADREKIRQALTNLVENSIKYGRENGNTRVSFFDMDENILVEVTDNGSGIEAANLPRLFERFFRTDKARSRDEGGSGLGLAIVKHILEVHGQTVTVRSTIGVGTTFGFTVEKGR
ncbi:MAG: ATP-binding protein [Bacteroidetes bacterium]|nr:ATP-binding protein [Bacteroidota bacterium]